MEEKLSILSELIKLSRIDGDHKEEEYNFMLAISKQLGVDRRDFERLFIEYADFTPPPMEFERIIQFHRLVLVANVDLEVESSEIRMLIESGLKLGLNHQAVENVLAEMSKHKNGMIPPNNLMEIFKVYHN